MNQMTMNITATSPILDARAFIPKSESTLQDFSLKKRIGVRGKQAREHLENNGFSVPKSPQSITETDDYIALQLAYEEYWLLAKTSGLKDISIVEDTYPVLCESSHAWLVLESDYKAEILSKVCGVDLAETVFKSGQLVQTVVAGVNTIILHHQLEQKTVFSLLCDRSYAQYLWNVLIDAMES
jgi:sarcosine oxidase subunit gamma